MRAIWGIMRSDPGRAYGATKDILILSRRDILGHKPFASAAKFAAVICTYAQFILVRHAHPPRISSDPTAPPSVRLAAIDQLRQLDRQSFAQYDFFTNLLFEKSCNTAESAHSFHRDVFFIDPLSRLLRLQSLDFD
ncbi:MAG: hypothetical protein ACJA06_000579 [Halocynthiibacter sp.]|jgi:hypothetical protein